MRDRFMSLIVALAAVLAFSPVALAGQRGGQAPAAPSVPHDPHDLSGVWTKTWRTLTFSEQAPPMTPEGKAKSRLSEFATIRHEVADRHIETEVLFNFAFRIVSMQNRGLVPNYEASMAKLWGSELSQRMALLGMQMQGLYGQLGRGSPQAMLNGRVLSMFLESPANTIRGGTSEVQRNIIAIRGLGLPR